MAIQPRTPLGHNPTDRARRGAAMKDGARTRYARPGEFTGGPYGRPGDVNGYRRPNDARLVRHPAHSVTRRRIAQFGGGGIERRDSTIYGRNPRSEDTGYRGRTM